MASAAAFSAAAFSAAVFSADALASASAFAFASAAALPRQPPFEMPGSNSVTYCYIMVLAMSDSQDVVSRSFDYHPVRMTARRRIVRDLFCLPGSEIGSHSSGA